MRPATILLFAKAPAPGAVKSRLASEIGLEAACAVYRWLGLRQLRALAADHEVVVLHAPPEATAAMHAWLGDDVRLRPQAGGDLGARLEAAARDAFHAGARSVVLIGADCPDLGSAEVALALARLEEGADAVFGPAADGGYYLLALRAPHTVLFEAIPWSSSTTLEVSLARARAAGLRVTLLPVKEDIDDLAGLRRAIAAGRVPEEALEGLRIG